MTDEFFNSTNVDNKMLIIDSLSIEETDDEIQ